MRRMLVLFFVGFGLMVTAAAMAQVSGGLSGRVVGSDGSPIPGVQIVICLCEQCADDCNCCPGAFSTVTDADGEYHFPSIPSGRVKVKGTLEGFASGSVEVRVPAGGSVSAPNLTLSTTSLESITVTSAAPLIEGTVLAAANGSVARSTPVVIRMKRCSTKACSKKAFAVKTDDSGVFQARLAPGLYEFFVPGPKGRAVWKTVEVSAATKTVVIDSATK